MKYRIISRRLGTPGDVYEPEIWVNIHHLLNAGFIEPIEDPAPKAAKPAKKKTDNDPQLED